MTGGIWSQNKMKVKYIKTLTNKHPDIYSYFTNHILYRGFTWIYNKSKGYFRELLEKILKVNQSQGESSSVLYSGDAGQLLILME